MSHSFFQFLEFFRVLMDLAAPLLVTLAIAYLFINSNSRRKLLRAFFLTSEGDFQQKSKDSEEIQRLSAELEEIRAIVDRPLSDDASADLRSRIDADIRANIPDIVKHHLQELKRNDSDILKHFQEVAATSAIDHLKKLPFTDLIAHAIYRESWETRRRSVDAFSTLLDQQLSAANSTRTIMMNLFVLINISLMATFFLNSGQISEKVSISILGVYISLSAFIIYIYRASNARSASLLSIKEDDKKLYDAFLFLTNFKKGVAFSNNEVDLVKSILINRFERERGGDHPYEVILKGVTNSNVLVRGGKVTSPKGTKGND